MPTLGVNRRLMIVVLRGHGTQIKRQACMPARPCSLAILFAIGGRLIWDEPGPGLHSINSALVPADEDVAF
jgi:hypothetical protein